jgi:NADH dehydrogenase
VPTALPLIPCLKPKHIAEEIIRRSGIDYTIIRSAVVYGPGDHFTLQFVRLAYLLPFVFPIPGDGQMKRSQFGSMTSLYALLGA